MLVFEFKAYGKSSQFAAVGEAIRTASNGVTVENPRFLRIGEKTLKRSQRRVSRKVKGSKNRGKARQILAKRHLKISRQRKDHAIKLARCVIGSNDLIAVR